MHPTLAFLEELRAQRMVLRDAIEAREPIDVRRELEEQVCALLVGSDHEVQHVRRTNVSYRDACYELAMVGTRARVPRWQTTVDRSRRDGRFDKRTHRERVADGFRDAYGDTVDVHTGIIGVLVDGYTNIWEQIERVYNETLVDRSSSYSLAMVTDLVLGRPDAKANDEYRLRYGEFDDMPLEA